MRLYVILSNLFFSFSIVAQHAKDIPFVLGSVINLKSNILSEPRTLNIYLPDDYSLDSTMTYPVIYLLDGSADEDFIHVVGLVQYLSFPWINGVPKSIVVGIANTNRAKDFTYPVDDLNFVTEFGFDVSRFTNAGGSAEFIDFIEKELQPFIESAYRLNDTKTIIGQSLGGLLVTEILLKRPHLFDTYLILSPSLWWDRGALVESAPGLLQSHTRDPYRVYIGIGYEGKDMIAYSKRLAKAIRKNSTSEVHFDYLPKEDHATMSHRAIYRAFELLYTRG